jgi:hypothetical protein
MKTTILILLISASLSSRGQTKINSQSNGNNKTTGVKETDTLLAGSTPEHLKEIIHKIAEINEVQHQYVGFAGRESENYMNFLQLKKAATTEELISLTQDTNNVVACYAAWALADMSYPGLPGIFTYFLDAHKRVNTFSGCIRSSFYDGSVELYHRYWNNLNLSLTDSIKATDKLLLQLDSIILYRNSNWLLMSRALENRVYPASYRSRLEHLAFNKGSSEALFYLCTWHRADNYENIKKSLLAYLQKTDFSNTGTTDYYRTLDELLKFRDREIEKLIVEKMKKDRHWKNDEYRFKGLLDEYSIYENLD